MTDSCPKCGFRQESITSGAFYCGMCGYTSGVNVSSVAQIPVKVAHSLETENKRLKDALEKIMLLGSCQGDCKSDTCPAGIAQKSLGYDSTKAKADVKCDHYQLEKKTERLEEENRELREVLDGIRDILQITTNFGKTISKSEQQKLLEVLREALKGESNG